VIAVHWDSAIKGYSRVLPIERPCMVGYLLDGGINQESRVEPAIELIRMAQAGLLPNHYTHLTILDAVNAFNTIDRGVVASSTLAFFPELFRAARWAYDSPSELYVLGEPPPTDDPPDLSSPRFLGKLGVLRSAQGVRQGDPLSAMLFSLGLRPYLESLIDHFGPSCLVFAYLDDIFILSSKDDMLATVLDSVDKLDCPVKFNSDKCKTVKLDDLNDSALPVLGSCLGTPSARREFLLDKIQGQEEILERLSLIDHQSALLLLRCCLQHNLRHLLRSLQTDDIVETWYRLHIALRKQIIRMRGLRPATDVPSAMISSVDFLPTNMGGLGLAPFPLIAKVSFTAATASARSRVSLLLGTETNVGAPALSQKDACSAVYTKIRLAALRNMSREDAVLHLESASPIGRMWLNIIPIRPSYILSDKEVSTSLALRGCHLVAVTKICPLCGKDYLPLHHDGCSGLKGPRVTRHNAVLHAIAGALRTIKGAEVIIEPPIEGSASLRNDIRFIPLNSANIQDMDIDITIRSMTSTRAAFRLNLPIRSIEAAVCGVDTVMARGRKEKRDKVASVSGYSRLDKFVVLPMSPGGYCDEEGIKFFKMLRKALSPTSYVYMTQKIALILVKARAHGARLS
jgi:hypothetical protein